MKIESLMTRHVEFAAGDDNVAELAVVMGDLDVGGLPIGSEGDLLGVVTDRDILYRVVAKGLDPKTVSARDIVSFPVVSCRPDDKLQVAMDLMGAHRIRRLAVRTEDGTVVGWLTLADLSRALLLDSGPVQSALRDLSRETAG
ncbi:MAG: CBS domain-containing protein [Methylobacterium sp.]